MATVFILQGDHPTTPGRVMKAHATRAGADAGAAELVNLILADLDPDEPKATAATWQDVLKRTLEIRAEELGVEVGELDESETGDVWITELEIHGAAAADPFRAFFELLAVSQNGSALNGSVTLPRQAMPAAIYDAAMGAAGFSTPSRRRTRKNVPRVCHASDEPPGNWSGDWLCITETGTSAHRTRDGAYSMLYQQHPELRPAD